MDIISEISSPDLSLVSVQIIDSFLNLEIPSETLAKVVIVLVSTVLLVLLAIGFNIIRARSKSKEEIPAGWIVDEGEAHSILETVFMQRNKVELQFHEHGLEKSLVTTSIESIDKYTITLSISDSRQVDSHWIGRKIDCYMRVIQNPTESKFYYFITVIKDIKILSEHLSQIIIEHPGTLIQQQKRNNLRIEPPYQHILGLAIWPAHVADPESNPLPVKNWGKPAATFSPDRRSTLTLLNLSARGARLLVRSALIKKFPDFLLTGKRLIIMIELYDPDKEGNIRTVAIAIVRNSQKGISGQSRELGMQFVKTAHPKQDGGVEWLDVDEEGIGSLDTWVMKRHLELYRDKGIT